jgi:hypothetical protein
MASCGLAKVKSSLKVDSRTDRSFCFIRFEIDSDQFGQRLVCQGITPFLEWYRDGLIDAPFGNTSSILP